MTDVTKLNTMPASDLPEAFVYGWKGVGQAKIAAADLMAPGQQALAMARQFAAARPYATWAALSPVVGEPGDVAVIFADAGIHADPVVGGDVSNSGFFIYSAGPAGWRRFSATDGQIARDWAEGVSPGGPGTKSAKEYAQDMALLLASLHLAGWPDTVMAVESSLGQIALRVRASDGATEIARLTDLTGKDVYAALTAAEAKVASLEAQVAMLIPSPERARLKRALFDGAPRKVAAVDPLTVSAWTTASSFANPVAIARDDQRIRFLGGPWANGTGFPGGYSRYCLARTNGDPSTIAPSTGLPGLKSAVDNAIEFVLPAGSTQFELCIIGQGWPGEFTIEIDGVGSNAAGYAAPPHTDGQSYYIKIALAAAGFDRTVRATMAGRPIFGLALPTGQTIKAAPPKVYSSIVFQGDSVTEGAGSGSPPAKWMRHATFRLGIDNAVNAALGGSGYIRRTPPTTGWNFRERIADVTQAINGGPPDAVIVAGGINDISVQPNQNGYNTPAELGAEALLYFQALRAAAPGMDIFALGPFCNWDTAGYNAHLHAGQDAIFAAAAQVSRCHTIDVSGLVTLANRDIVFNGQASGPHPTPAGHAIYGEFIAAAVADIVRGF